MKLCYDVFIKMGFYYMPSIGWAHPDLSKVLLFRANDAQSAPYVLKLRDWMRDELLHDAIYSIVETVEELCDNLDDLEFSLSLVEKGVFKASPMPKVPVALPDDLVD